MRIALVSPEYPPFFGGGVGTYTESLAALLCERGHSVHVLTARRPGPSPSLEANGRLTVHRFDSPPGDRVWARSLLGFSAVAARRLAELHAGAEIDVAEFADTEAPGFAHAMARMTGASRLPMALTFHTSSEAMHALGSLGFAPDDSASALFLAERMCALGADATSAPSAMHARRAAEFFSLSATPAPIANPLPRWPERAEPVRSRRALFVGRIEPGKGVAPLLAAWERVIDAVPSATLRLVGRSTRTGPRGVSLQTHLESLLSPRARASVEFAGALPPHRLGAEYAGAALCVAPSLHETFGYTCAEAMAAGRAVVATTEGASRELIGETDAGVIVPPGDPDALADALIPLLRESDARLAARGAIARDRALAHCDPDAIVRARLDLYAAAIERAAAGRVHDAASRLEFWRKAREAAAFGVSAFPAPALPAQVAHWLTKETAA